MTIKTALCKISGIFITESFNYDQFDCKGCIYISTLPYLLSGNYINHHKDFGFKIS